MSMEDRIAEIFDASDDQFEMMLAGAMHKLKTENQSLGWAEVRIWIERLNSARADELQSLVDREHHETF